MSDTPPVGDVPSTSGEHTDVASPAAIQLRADARLAKRVRYLQNELDGKNALIAQLNAAKADADGHQKNFDRLVVALRAAKSGEFQHVVGALQRARQ
jgi:hypothetical protein